MAVRFEINGRTGNLDVVKLAREQLNGEVVGVQQGIIQVRSDDGKLYGFSLAKWADKHQAKILMINQGFNSPETALDQLPRNHAITTPGYSTV